MCDIDTNAKSFRIAERDIKIYKGIGANGRSYFRNSNHRKNEVMLYKMLIPEVLWNELRVEKGSPQYKVIDATGTTYAPGYRYDSPFTETLGLFCFIGYHNLRAYFYGHPIYLHTVVGYVPKGTRYLLCVSKGGISAETLIITERRLVKV